MSVIITGTPELYHHGVLGMRWGHRKDRIKNTVVNVKKQVKKELVKNYRDRKVESLDQKVSSSRKKANEFKKRNPSGISSTNIGLYKLTDMNKNLAKVYSDRAEDFLKRKKKLTSMRITTKTTRKDVVNRYRDYEITNREILNKAASGAKFIYNYGGTIMSLFKG